VHKRHLKPVIDNDRVAVWDVPGPTDAQPLDAVVVSLSGSAEFLPKGMTPKLDEGIPPEDPSSRPCSQIVPRQNSVQS
jgi:hypothetical protein